MRKMFMIAAMFSVLSCGCTAVVVRQPATHVVVSPQFPSQEVPPPVRQKLPGDADVSGAIYFFRLGW